MSETPDVSMNLLELEDGLITQDSANTELLKVMFDSG